MADDSDDVMAIDEFLRDGGGAHAIAGVIPEQHLNARCVA